MITSPPPAVQVRGLDFRYPGSDRAALRALTLTIGAGERCLLVGANGAGKSTMLAILGGQYAVAPGEVRVLGGPAFGDPAIAARVTHVGAPFVWGRETAVAALLPAADSERLDRLVELLGVDLRWRPGELSPGQRRRVQLLVQLVTAGDLVLVDESVAELDPGARGSVLRFLGRDAQARGATILHATHVLDGLEDWATHLCLLDAGRVRLHARLGDIPELGELREARVTSPLHRLVERLLRD